MKRFLTLLLALLAVPIAAQDEGEAPWIEEYDPRDFTCPLGGEVFRQDVGYPTYPLASFPDGSWLGDIAIGAQIPQCPGNGLVILPDFPAMEAEGEQGMVYRDYTAAELARLPALIADPAYAALAADGRYAQAYWLATRLDRPASDRLIFLQRATWAALAPELRRRLVEQFVAEAPALIAASDLPDGAKRFQTGYVVNGLRELGRFDEALALLDGLEAAGGPVPAQTDPDAMFVAEFGSQMRLAIEQRDDGRFPVELLGRRLVGMVCGDETFPPYDQRTPGNIAACKARDERLEREAMEDEQAWAEAEALDATPAERDRLCAATPPDERSRGLEMACSPVEWERDRKAADELLLNDPAQVAADCALTPEDGRKGALFFACISYGIAVDGAMERILADDDATYAVLCFEGGKGDDSPDITEIQRFCASAKSTRDEREETTLLADPVALDAKCAATAEYERPGGLLGACITRESDLARQERAAVAADDGEFERRCGSAPEGDYATMSREEFEIASFCGDVRRERMIAEEEAAGLTCTDEFVDEAEGEEFDFSTERRCYSEAELAAREQDDGERPYSFFDDASGLSQVAREAAARNIAALLAEAKAGE